jgi:long-chain acyl-CoA synthetase
MNSAEPVGDGFWAHARSAPQRCAVVGTDGAEVTRGALLERVNQLSHGLRWLGVGTGDVVAALLPNGVGLLALMLAIEQIGIRLVIQDTHAPAAEVARILSDAGARAFVADGRFAETAAQAASIAAVPPRACFASGVIPGFRPLEELVDGQPCSEPDNRTAGHVMPYTSGTTGASKGVWRALLPVPPEPVLSFISQALVDRFGFDRGDGTHLVLAPMHYAAPGGFATVLSHLGHRVVLTDGFDPLGSLALIERYRVTSTFVTPTMIRRWLALRDAAPAPFDLRSLRQVIHGGAPCPIETKRRALDWLGPKVYEVYSSSEGGFVTVSAEDWLAHPGTVGRPGSDEVVILDSDGGALPHGASGTVCFKKSPVVPWQYHNDPDKTAQAGRGDYFTVGDLGHLDEGSWLYIDDRRSDLIVSAGVNIYPAEIEGQLLQHPAVQDAALIGVPDQEWGQRAVALVETAGDLAADASLAEELERFLRNTVSAYKVPRSYEFLDSLGRSASGKLSRSRLREEFLRRVRSAAATA